MAYVHALIIMLAIYGAINLLLRGRKWLKSSHKCIPLKWLYFSLIRHRDYCHAGFDCPHYDYRMCFRYRWQRCLFPELRSER